MRITKWIMAGVAAAALAGLMAARAGQYTMLSSLVTVNNTSSNSAAITSGYTYVPAGTLLIADAGLIATNDLRINVQISVDNTNFVTAATYYPSTTNSGTTGFSVSLTNFPIYMRVQAVTTNSVQVGGTYLN